jgi:hypothetical protein
LTGKKFTKTKPTRYLQEMRWIHDTMQLLPGSGTIEEVVPVSGLLIIFAEAFPGCFITSAFIDSAELWAYRKLFAVYPTRMHYIIERILRKGASRLLSAPPLPPILLMYFKMH